MKLKLLLLIFLWLIFINPISAQNHWSTDFNGAPVKQEVVVRYHLNDAGEKTNWKDSTVITYYADGKINMSQTVFEIEGQKYSTRTVYHYSGDSLKHKYYFHNDRLESVAVTSKSDHPLFPTQTYSFTNALKAHIGESPENTTTYSYDKDYRLISSTFKTINSSRKIVVESTYNYKKGLLKSTATVYTRDTDAPKKWSANYETIKKNKHGWQVQKEITEQESLLAERHLTFYTDAELKNKNNLYKKQPPRFSLADLMTELNRDIYKSDSTTSKQIKLIDLAIALIEQDPEKQKETDYNLTNIYKFKIEYLAKNGELQKAIDVSKRGLKYVASDSEESKDKFYTILSYLNEQKGDIEAALSYYEQYYTKTSPFGYDPLGNFKSLRIADLYIANNQIPKAKAALAPNIKETDRLLAKDVSSYDLDNFEVHSFFGFVESLSDLLIKTGDLNKAELYLTKVGKYYELAYGKDSNDYKNNLQKLNEVKSSK
ncbi:MAG: hypothetical protein LPK19_01485 [Hymenobacteraceae bacterium]|nr:hypothetical protein [Hymenobacteraceae bacterium]MDX5394846.1 hypothetical protein [Hymenobacteraceae bacterium]MDX5510880.1 hypothetical protein [Hymenobacteraceae bacterium]